MATATDPLAALIKPARHLFLSPHYDDIALSAGATVRLLADRGRNLETAIVFGSEPDPAQPLSPFAQSLHQDWGFTAGEVIASRRAEESAAAAVLGAHKRILPFRDAIYREAYYLSDEDLFGVPADQEGNLPARIAASLDLPPRPDADIRLYAPLAIGKHVDHQLVFVAAALLAGQGWDVWFYEDIPYSLKPGAFATRLHELGETVPIAPAARIPVEETWGAKLDAILCYPSQLETVFRGYVGVGSNRVEIDAALREYATQGYEGPLVERFWNVRHASSGAGS